MNKIIGPRIAEARRLRRLTQNQLAARVGVTKQTISNYENNVRSPDFEMLDSIALALDTTLGFLIGSTDNPAAYPPVDETPFDPHTVLARSPEWRVMSEGLGTLESINKAAFLATYNYLKAMYPDIFTERIDDDAHDTES